MDVIALIDNTLSSLKDFQRETVKSVMTSFRQGDSQRGLVSDEVGLCKTIVAKGVIDELMKEPYIQTAVGLSEIAEAALPSIQKERLINGYTPGRSGDIQFVFKPGFFDGFSKGTTHGLWNPYDSHIPLLFFGTGIKTGKLNRETYMTDIAATIAAMLQIQMPSGCVGHVITEAMK